MNEEENFSEYLNISEDKEIYFNDFVIGISKRDVFISLIRNGRQKSVLNTSYINAKSFANALLEAIKDFESKSGIEIPDPQKIEDLVEGEDNE